MNSLNRLRGILVVTACAATCASADTRCCDHSGSPANSPAAADPRSPAATHEDILAKVRAAIGTDRLARLATGVELTGTTSIIGLPHRFSILLSGKGSVVQRINTQADNPVPGAGLNIASGVEGDVVWVTDIGGETRRVHNADRERYLLALLIASGTAFVDPSPLDFVTDDSAADAGQRPIRFSLRGGRSAGTVYVNEQTNLPTRWVFGSGAETTTVSIDEYTTFEGIALPMRVRTESGEMMSSESVITGAKSAPVFVASPYALRVGTGADTAFDPAASPDLEVVVAPTGHLLVHPLVNGKDVGWFIFDTGAGNSVLTTGVAAELGIPTFGSVPAKGVGGSVAAAFCRPAELRLGAVTMRDPLMATMDLSFLDQYMGRKIAGLIGYNLLAQVVAKIDLISPAISLHDPAAFAGDGLKWEKLIPDSRVPVVEAAFEGHKGLFALDTGAGQMYVSMHEPAVRELKLLEGRTTTESRSGGIGGFVNVRRGEAEWFEIGGKRIEKFPAEFATEAKGAFGNPFVLGNIGGKMLQPFVIVTDYLNERIAFVERAPKSGG